MGDPSHSQESYHSGGRMGRLKSFLDTSLDPLWFGHLGTYNCPPVVTNRKGAESSGLNMFCIFRVVKAL